MDNSFAIKPRPGTPQFPQRDSARKREEPEAAEDTAHDAAPAGHDGGDPHDRHAPPDIAVDPESRAVINRANDISAQDRHRGHPDQALLRFRAYRPAPPAGGEHPHDEPHANLKA